MTLLHDIYYYGFLNALTTSWLNISSILSLLFGLKTIIFYNKSTNGADKSLRKVFCFDIDDILSYFIIDFDTSDYKDMMSS